MADRDTVLTMAGSPNVPISKAVKVTVRGGGIRVSARRGPRHCTEVGVSDKGKGQFCRCLKWKPGVGGDSVHAQCKRKGLSMGLKKLR